MTTVTFDTLKFAERLEKAGMSREQASAIAEAQKEAFSEALETQIATKSDILRLENRMDAMELRLTVKLGAFIAIAVGIIAALVKLG